MRNSFGFMMSNWMWLKIKGRGKNVSRWSPGVTQFQRLERDDAPTVVVGAATSTYKQLETTKALKSDQIINLVTLVGESKLAFWRERRPLVCSMLWHGEIMSLFLEAACGLRRGLLFTRWTSGFARGAETGQNNPKHAHKQAQLRQLM